MKQYLSNIKKSFKLKNYLNYMIVLAVFVLFTALYYADALNRSTPTLLNQIAYSIILAVSLNLVVGFLGELSLGHAGFMCVGAYIGTFVSNIFLGAGMGNVLAVVISIFIGGAIAAVFGFIVGLPALRLRGDYLAIVTLAFGEIVRNICRNIEVFGGARGLVSEAYTANLYNKSVPLFLITFVLFFVMLIVVQNLVRSKHGRSITAIRDNEIAARAMGVNVTYYKLMVFVIAAFFAGAAGVVYGASVSPVEYSNFSYNYSIEILVMVVLGGMGSVNGSMLAATIITVLNFYLKNYLSEVAYVKTLVYALILIIMVIYKNAPALRAFREKYNLSNLIGKFRKHDPSKEGSDSGRWDVVPTKISMNEVLSTDVVVRESRAEKGDKEVK